ncbi:E3 ubiquitin- ligase SMURF2-like [Paramuricea clavata]|uniref:HECT-type E3 ubiquitin transferase n=1 Tax=Paramuricea clavata TaxID=317549 RepID=A0A6S7ITT1_PARCT|nr:E3 ubiquitin- ligase SMURF2-like [Paramuricea clavata]
MRAQGGGYSRPLCLIPIPSDGYSVPYLKEMVGASTTIYIRPMKESLSAEKAPVSLSPDSPLTECTTCNKQVPIFALRQHSKDCGAIDINSDTEEIEDILNQDDGEVVIEDTANLNSPSTSEDKIAAVNTPSTSEVKIVSDSDKPDKQTPDKEENISLEDLIESFVEKNELSGDECILVDRETLWMDVVKFYKRSLTKPDILRKELCVSFKNEEGLDGGAMKIEFFSLALNEVKSRLFEGAEPNMVPIKDETKGMLFQLAGVIVSHALFQRSSIGFPFLAPHIYSYIVGEEEDETISKITKEHIPLDSSTALLHEFINCLETCKNDDDIHQLLEENSKCEAFWQIINSSRWPKEKVINMSSKDFLLQHLVSHELLVSRKNEIQEFSEGLKSLSLLKLLQKNKEICTILFTAGEFQPLTADGIMEMIIAVETHSFSERQAYEWLKSYINEDEDEEFPGDSRQRALLQFWTGWTAVPFGGLAKRLKVAFLADDDTKSLPTTSSCTAVLRIPTVHSSKKGFFEAMNIALKFGRVGFPNP